ncbi:MAG: Sec-independent protein translocase protein TatB [Woeseiaceae bacterium]
MSGFSSPEFLLIVVLALVVLGPKRLPEIANKVGSWVGQARRLTRVMRRQLEEELEVEDLNDLNDINKIGAPKIGQTPPATVAEEAAEPEAEMSPEDEQAPEIDAPRADHIPNDDDTYSPLHSEDDEEKTA